MLGILRIKTARAVFDCVCPVERQRLTSHANGVVQRFRRQSLNRISVNGLDGSGSGCGHDDFFLTFKQWGGDNCPAQSCVARGEHWTANDAMIRPLRPRPTRRCEYVRNSPILWTSPLLQKLVHTAFIIVAKPPYLPWARRRKRGSP